MPFTNSIRSNPGSLSSTEISLVHLRGRDWTNDGSWKDVLRSHSGTFTGFDSSDDLSQQADSMTNDSAASISARYNRMGGQRAWATMSPSRNAEIWSTIMALLQTFWTTERDSFSEEQLTIVSAPYSLTYLPYDTSKLRSLLFDSTRTKFFS